MSVYKAIITPRNEIRYIDVSDQEIKDHCIDVLDAYDVTDSWEESLIRYITGDSAKHTRYKVVRVDYENKTAWFE